MHQGPETATADERDAIVRRAANELEKRGAATIHHARWSLLEHLLNTSAILDQWGEETHVVLAGLLHSAYATEHFSTQLFSLKERGLLRDLIGARAEHLVHAFCTYRLRDLTGLHSDNGMKLARNDVSVSNAERDELILIHLANLAHQSAAPNGSPSPWLARASELARLVRRPLPTILRAFEALTLDETKEKENNLLAAYHNVLRGHDITEESLRKLETVAMEAPWVAEPFIWLGIHAFATRDFRKASSLGERASELLLGWNCAWDKRLSALNWLALAHFLASATEQAPQEREFFSVRVSKLLAGTTNKPAGVFCTLSEFGVLGNATLDSQSGGANNAIATISGSGLREEDFDAVPERFADYLVSLRDRGSPLRMYPGLTSAAWWNPRNFALTQDLESNYAAIVNEFNNLGAHAFQSESESIARSGEWDVLFLYEPGRKHDERCQLTPTLTEILETHGDVRTQGGLVYFSRLAPGSAILPHRGPTNMRLRCHLGIKIPDLCGISVDGEARTWTAGECLVFDDSFEHEAWNNSDAERVVLVIDVWHPDLSSYEIELLEGLHRHVATSAFKLKQYWQSNDEARRLISMEI